MCIYVFSLKYLKSKGQELMATSLIPSVVYCVGQFIFESIYNVLRVHDIEFVI